MLFAKIDTLLFKIAQEKRQLLSGSADNTYGCSVGCEIGVNVKYGDIVQKN